VDSDRLLEAKNLIKRYPVKGGLFLKTQGSVSAVDGVDLVIQKGRTLGLVGESGCGKSTLARLLLRLEEPDQGEVLYEGVPLRSVSRDFRKGVQGIFQDPYGTLDPRFTIEQSLEEGLKHLLRERSSRRRRKQINEALSAAGLTEKILDRFPHEFSGGQRQRIGIARALILEPQLLICDEPVSSLDVSVSAQIIQLLSTLKKERNLSMLVISHNLGIINALADDIAVMYLGRIVESGPRADVISKPLHPYTQALMSSVPRLGEKKIFYQKGFLKDDPPSAAHLPSGCHFHPRCAKVLGHCSEVDPVLQKEGAQHRVACHLY
jgi:peptide/nickel transport system ATP-binding protein